MVRGTAVVDVVSGRKACALGLTKTHIKVRFEASGVGWPPRLEEESTAIVPLARIRAWTPQWEGRAGEGGALADLNGALVLPAMGVPLSCSQQSRVREIPEHLHKGMAFALQDRICCAFDRVDGDCADGLRDLRNFRSLARTRCQGSLFAAWRTCLNPRGLLRLQYADFVRGGRSLGYTGNYRKLWTALMRTLPSGTDGECFLTFNMLDPKGAKMLTDFLILMEAQGLTLEEIWEKHLDPDGSGRCYVDDFTPCLVDLGFPYSEALSLFHMLDIGGQQDISFDELVMAGLQRRQVKVAVRSSIRELLQRRDEKAHGRLLSEFHGYMLHNYGSLVRAWRLGLDVENRGQLCFNEFCESCKRIGFRGRLRTLWKQLDSESVGYITLATLDPQTQAALDDLRSFLEENYRTIDDAWERVIDIRRAGRVARDAFVDASREKLGWQGDALRVFHCLDLTQSGLTVDQMEFIGMRRRVIGTKSAKEKILERQAKDRKEADAMLANFCGFLVRSHGNLVRAWRRVMDPDGDGKLQFTEFCARCRDISFQGNLKALWLALDDDDTGIVELAELDPEGFVYLQEFERLLAIFFDDLDSAWYTMLDNDQSGRCSLDEFQDACHQLGYVRKSEQLYQYLDVTGIGFLTLDQLKVFSLQRARSKDECLRYVQDSGERTRNAFSSFLSMTYRCNIVVAWRRCMCSLPKDLHWTETFNAEEFCSRCRAVGFHGNYVPLWYELRNGRHIEAAQKDLAERCCITIDGIDLMKAKTRAEWTHVKSQNGQQQVDALGRLHIRDALPEDVIGELESFREHCATRYGNLVDSWNALSQAVMKPSEARMRKVEFMQAARQINFQGSADAIYDALDFDVEGTIAFDDFAFLQIGL